MTRASTQIGRSAGRPKTVTPPDPMPVIACRWGKRPAFLYYRGAERIHPPFGPQARPGAGRGRCEYCQTLGWPLTIDHVRPVRASPVDRIAEQLGPFVLDAPENLAAACFTCNRAKWNAISGYDALTDRDVPLFHPRVERWDEHFSWMSDYLEIVGLTPTGRATVARLRLNRQVYRQQRSRLLAAMRGGAPPWL